MKCVILGSGPVGLICAIAAKHLGAEVEIRSRHHPVVNDPPSIERVPPQTVALLVEFGVAPFEIGVSELYRYETRSWSSHTPLRLERHAAAHLCRPELDIALLRRALQLGVSFTSVGSIRADEVESSEPGLAVIDATGRGAVTARVLVRPRRTLAARTFVTSETKGFTGDFCCAAGSEGYVYRLGNQRQQLIGVVGQGGFVSGSWESVSSSISQIGPWILKGLPEHMDKGRSGPASCQWAESSSAIPIGDAALARDALSSQGLASGLTHAVQTARMCVTCSSSGPPFDVASSVKKHLVAVSEIIAGAPFAKADRWEDYMHFLDNAERAPPSPALRHFVDA